MEEMIYRHEIECLTDEEKGMLIYALNEVFRSKVKVDLDTVTAYKRPALESKLRAAKKTVKPQHIDIYCDMCAKLKVDV
jgi:hypothetical protein